MSFIEISSQRTSSYHTKALNPPIPHLIEVVLGPGAKLKAIDFGVSKFISENEVLHEMVGSIYYIAPEVLTRNYSFPADIWSAGIIVYILLCGAADTFISS